MLTTMTKSVKANRAIGAAKAITDKVTTCDRSCRGPRDRHTLLGVGQNAATDAFETFPSRTQREAGRGGGAVRAAWKAAGRGDHTSDGIGDDHAGDRKNHSSSMSCWYMFEAPHAKTISR